MEGSHDEAQAKLPQQQSAVSENADTIMNLALSDPPRWGWTAAGTLADLLPPHEKSRRRGARVTFRQLKRQRASDTSSASIPPSGLRDAPNPQLSMTPVFFATFPSVTPSVPSKFSTEEPSTKSYTISDECSEVQPSCSLPVVPKSAAPESTKGDEKKENDVLGGVSLRGAVTECDTEKLAPDALGAVFAVGISEGTQAPLPRSIVNQNTEPTASDTQELKEKQQLAPLVDVVKLFGVEQQYLGMEIQRAPLSNADKNKKGKEVYNCNVMALSKSCTLDMYTYHRGREGFELRDPYSGMLKCPGPPTDTNHNYDGPRMELKVLIEFPLYDDNEISASSVPTFREIFDWDLSDPRTPSPAVFANQIATEFGLSYGQMMDLAMSVESQIDVHVQQNWNYCAPLSMMDPLGNERRSGGQTIHRHRFDQILRIAEGGTRMKTKEKQRSVSRAPFAAGSFPSAKKKRVDDQNVDDIDEIFVDEIRRRSRIESTLDITSKCKNGVVGLMERKSDDYCHICKKSCEIVFGFACGFSGHVYCETHCKLRLEEGFNPEVPISTFCPICSMVCSCIRCLRKARTVAVDFKTIMDAKGTGMEDTKFDGLIVKGRNLVPGKVGAGKRRGSSNMSRDEDVAWASGRTSNTSKAPQRKTRPSSVRPESRSNLMVAKPPLTEFPREIVGSVEVDRATASDYLTVFTANGNYMADSFPEAWADESCLDVEIAESVQNSGELVEDGNVDYCQICSSHGNLVCCDYCPRAFHTECIEVKSRPISDTRWECMVCLREKEGLEDDLIDAEKSVDTIIASFARNEVKVDLEAKEIKAISAIYLMILKLLDYDFGYMFAKPVDVASVPDYKAIVKEPMDLGTITKKLTNGGYAKIMKATTSDGTEPSLDALLIALLKDIELVWHNCLLFNFDGSAIYRMASVQRRRALSIRKKSFDHLLSDRVKHAVEEYVLLCENARVKVTTQQGGQLPTIDEKEQELRARKPKGKHKITTTIAKPKVNRTVAILDSSTGRLVKTYSSLNSAYHAALSIAELGYRCEQFPSYENIKIGLQRSQTDPSSRFFGYRWVFLDDLKAGKVAFRKIPYDAFQVHYGGHTFTFASIDEAASFPSSGQSATELLQEISKLEHGCEWTNIFGSMWRRLLVVPQSVTSDEEAPTILKEKMEKEIFASCPIVKKDLITGRKLVGYSTFDAAFADWRQLAFMSPLFPLPEDRSKENFNLRFLDGDRSIDGLVWHSQVATRVDPVVRTTEDAAKISFLSNGVPPSPLVASVRSDTKRMLEHGSEDVSGSEPKRLKGEQPLLLSDGPRMSPIAISPQRTTPLWGIQLFKKAASPSTSPEVKVGQKEESVT